MGCLGEPWEGEEEVEPVAGINEAQSLAWDMVRTTTCVPAPPKGKRSTGRGRERQKTNSERQQATTLCRTPGNDDADVHERIRQDVEGEAGAQTDPVHMIRTPNGRLISKETAICMLREAFDNQGKLSKDRLKRIVQ